MPVLSSRLLGPIAAFALVSAVFACGKDEDPSTFDKNGEDDGSGSLTDDPNGDGNVGGDAAGNGEQCAVANVEATLAVNLVVMYDRSGSMGDSTENPDFDRTKRWDPVGTAMKAFFSDASSAGLNAALTFFPSASNSCNVADYSTAQIALTPLPAASFTTTIEATSPKGDTPTRAAVKGAIAQAQAIATAHPTEKSAIVLVTDGEPYGCGITDPTASGAEINAIAADVSAVSATIPLYVIGVGPSVSQLETVATAGKTTAFQVQVGNPAQTNADLLAAMKAIRGNIARCDFDIPTPPDGRKLDLDKVNVVFSPAGQSPQTLVYSADCADPTGWHFDDPVAPKKVLLCTNACGTVKADAGGKLNVAFDCKNRADVK